VQAEAFQPEVVLLDIGLPLMDGYEVARRLRELPATRDVLLIALTGYGQSADRQHGREAGFDEHLLKPIDPSVLDALIARGRVLSSDAPADTGGDAPARAAGATVYTLRRS
jgi:CheY-like chemotaxis protein